ncbi:MAG: chromate transporter [Chroococcidiopsidaceae cyanobacterium CP_BM_RX_35]|nr:chromate transporter [Chroococcidiopsidaceae cyanobacterium CP_BM_RX_35]
MNNRSVEPSLPKVSLADLVLGFSKIAVASLGGGLSVWSRLVIVEQRRWMSDEEFLSGLTLCRVLPGANQINMAVYVGARLRGFPGVLSALLGLLFLPTCFIATIGIAYTHYHEVPALRSALRGATAASVGMTLAMGFQIGARYLTQKMALVFILAAFLAAGVLRWPLLPTLVVLMPLSIYLNWPRQSPANKEDSAP